MAIVDNLSRIFLLFLAFDHSSAINGNLTINIVKMASAKTLGSLIPGCVDLSCTDFYLVFNVTVITESQWLSHSPFNIPISQSNTNLKDVNYVWTIRNPSGDIFTKMLVQLQARLPTFSPVTETLCGWESLPLQYLPLNSFMSFTICGDAKFQYSYEYKCAMPGYFGLNCDCSNTDSANQCYNCTSAGVKICCPGYTGVNCSFAPTTTGSSSASKSTSLVSNSSTQSHTSFSPCTCPSVPSPPDNATSVCPGKHNDYYYQTTDNPFYVATWALTSGAIIFLIIILILLLIAIERHRKARDLQRQINRAQTVLKTTPYTLGYVKPNGTSNRDNFSTRGGTSTTRDLYEYDTNSRNRDLNGIVDRALYQRRTKVLPPLENVTEDSEIDFDPGQENPSYDDVEDGTPVYRPITRV